MNHRKLLGAAALAAALGSQPLAAQTVSFLPGTTYNTTGLTGFSTLGSQMDGMQVFWSLVGGGGGSSTWGSLGGGLSGISSGGLILSIGSTTNTFNNPWSLSNNTGSSLASVILSGAQGRTIFDCDWTGTQCAGPGDSNGSTGTPGSANGYTVQTAGGTYAGPVSAIYSNFVSIGANPPVGDLFEQLQLVFGTDGMSNGLTYSFIADTDNSPFDVPPPTTAVPEPGTVVLLATGLLGLAAAQRRRRKQS